MWKWDRVRAIPFLGIFLFRSSVLCLCSEYETGHKLIKKKIKFSSYLRKFRVEQLQVIYEEGLPKI